MGKGNTLAPPQTKLENVAEVNQKSFDTQEGLQNVVIQETLDLAPEAKQTLQIKETITTQPLTVALSEARVPETKIDKPTNQTFAQDIQQVSMSTTLQPLSTALTVGQETMESLTNESSKDTDKTLHKVGIGLEHQIPQLHDTSGATVECTQEVNVTMMPDALFVHTLYVCAFLYNLTLCFVFYPFHSSFLISESFT